MMLYPMTATTHYYINIWQRDLVQGNPLETAIYVPSYYRKVLREPG